MNGANDLNSDKLLDLAVTALESLKGQELVRLDIAKMSTIADYMLVVTATSSRHARSLADEVVKQCKDADVNVRSVEGQEQGEWVLIDLGDVLVHVMQAAVRKLYDLESLWKLTPAVSG
jgi:ribosome-associated protein